VQEELHLETVRKLKDLHKYDCLRANKSTMAWGLEARVPFLDRAFLDVAMGIDPAEKLIRKAEGANAHVDCKTCNAASIRHVLRHCSRSTP
jgi:asparagine synthetase B (glutamine-hydrolysing)